MSTPLGKKPDPKPGISPSERPGPKGGKRQQNRARRTRQLCDAGLGLFLERGVEAVTIDEIVKRAGVAKGSFYRYFQDKEQLVSAIVQPIVLVLSAAFDRAAEALRAASGAGDLVGAYRRLITDLALPTEELREEIKLYLQEAPAPAVGARKPIEKLKSLVRDRAIEMTHIGHERGLLVNTHDARVTALAVVGAVERLLLAYMQDELALPEPARTALTVVSMVLDGLRPPG